MPKFFKATRPDGTDFYTGTIDYAAALASGKPVKPQPYVGHGHLDLCGPGVLHAADVPTETLVGGWWPCRLFAVEGEPLALPSSEEHPHKLGFAELRVVEELDAHVALGPQGKEIAALIDRARNLTAEELDQMDAAWDAASAAWDAAWDAACAAAWDAARDAASAAARDAASAAARDAASAAASAAARDAARDAVLALTVRDILLQTPDGTAHYRKLVRPWQSVIGPAHPDDVAAATS